MLIKIAFIKCNKNDKFTLLQRKMRNKYLDLIIKSIDLLLIVLVLSFLINDLISILISLFNTIYNYSNAQDIIYNMASPQDSPLGAGTSIVNTPTSHNTDVRVIHDDGSWANSIKSLFIFGTGALRLHLARGGTPASRTFIIASTIATDALSKFITNTINDPAYVRSHFENWSAIWENGKAGVAKINLDTETSKKMGEALNSPQDSPLEAGARFNENITSAVTKGSEETVVNNFAAAPYGMEDISNKIIKYIMDIIRPILEPVTTNYSNEVLANQIYDLSILLFILSILISILILGLLINILVLINSNRILNLFTNKYIRWYVNVNMKLISIEVFCLGSSILYFMHTLSTGLQYIATHPIIFN